MESTVFFIVLGVLLAAVLVMWMASPAQKGARGEQAVHDILRQSLPSSDYAVLRDVMLRSEDGVVQIDHVVVSRFGIFVIETIDLDGWIFGSGKDSHWILSLDDSRTEFPNPLWANRPRIQALQTLLGLRATKFHSLVVFAGKVQFRNPMPVNVMLLERLVAFVQVRNTPSLSLEEAARADQAIETHRLERDALSADEYSEPLPAHPAPLAYAARSTTRTRSPRSPAFGRRLAIRALAGAASIALVLVVGNVLLGGFSGLDSMGGSWQTANYPYPSHPPLAARAEQAVEPEAQPELAALQCNFAEATRRCACFDASGEKVPVELEQCLALAGGDPR